MSLEERRNLPGEAGMAMGQVSEAGTVFSPPPTPGGRKGVREGCGGQRLGEQRGREKRRMRGRGLPRGLREGRQESGLAEVPFLLRGMAPCGNGHVAKANQDIQ